MLLDLVCCYVANATPKMLTQLPSGSDEMTPTPHRQAGFSVTDDIAHDQVATQ